MALVDELVGTRHPCTPYPPGKAQQHFELLREADEFRAAAALYPDEQDDLLEHAVHRYQAILDMAVDHLELPVSHLDQSAVTFRPFAELAAEHGSGTQAYTSESDRPQVGISELSFADLGLMQLLLIHEMQHAADFAYRQGLAMGIIERELRARVSVAHALRAIQFEWPTLYQMAVLDEAYFFMLTFWLPDWDDQRRAPYMEALEDEAKAKLQAGLYFSPMHMRALTPELRRADISVDTGQVYWLERQGDHWTRQQRALEHDWTQEVPEDQADGASGEDPGNWHMFSSQYAALQERSDPANNPDGVPTRPAPGGQGYDSKRYAVETGSDPSSDEVINTLRSFLGG